MTPTPRAPAQKAWIVSIMTLAPVTQTVVIHIASMGPLPIASMYGILFTYIYHKNQLNVGRYTIHGSYGMVYLGKFPPTKIQTIGGIVRASPCTHH